MEINNNAIFVIYDEDRITTRIKYLLEQYDKIGLTVISRCDNEHDNKVALSKCGRLIILKENGYAPYNASAYIALASLNGIPHYFVDGGKCKKTIVFSNAGLYTAWTVFVFVFTVLFMLNII